MCVRVYLCMCHCCTEQFRDLHQLYCKFTSGCSDISRSFTFSNFVSYVCLWGSRGSSGSVVSDYGLDDRAIEVRSPTGADFSSSPCVQTGSEAHPASYPMGTGGKARPGRDADHSPPSSAEVKNE
jgi:hypothetical protein